MAEVGNVFVRGGDGDDAIAVTSGSNVLDGGAGSNFLVGGSGADGGTDTFFTDLRDGKTSWNTVVNFHAGDAATVWGFDPAASSCRWDGVAGAQGYTGATLRIDLHGAGRTDASITFAGLTSEQGSTMGIVTGNIAGQTYLLIRA